MRGAWVWTWGLRSLEKKKCEEERLGMYLIDIDVYKTLLSLSFFLFFFSLGRKTINQSIETNKTRYTYIHHEGLHPRCVALCCWNSTGFLGTSFLLYPPQQTSTPTTTFFIPNFSHPLTISLPSSSASTLKDPNSEYAEVSKAMPENPTWDVDLRRYVPYSSIIIIHTRNICTNLVF